MGKYLRLLPLGILFVILLALSLGLVGNGGAPVAKSRMIGQKPGIFDLTVLDVPQGHFAPKMWLGRTVMLNVFASWCEPCAAEHALLMKLSQSRRVEIFGLAWKDTADKTRAWLKERGNPYSMVGMDPIGQTTVHLGLSGVPETMIIDPSGTVVYHHKAQLTEAEIDTVIIPLLNQMQSGNAPGR